ncbi:hypothetical protein ANCDUO_05738 [Ancylostoma duodenale]|uniref:DDE-1 domain-containing protein n=1 Tax=Ancylostoma duodenale TaxID=51022 RepID=A0A0C2H3G0_9BILA|nr:hypothetical protein ANCDUO_05738 [Ancylostoma duodenale]
MQNRFRWIQTSNHLQKLRNIAAQEEIRAERRVALKRLAVLLEEKASLRWINCFKAQAGIRSRRVTKFVAKRIYRDREKVEETASKFVAKARAEIKDIPLSCVANADQSGFSKELTIPRSLGPVGVKRVERIVQSSAAISHSYTILPLLFADGRLGQYLFVLLQEKSALFPHKGHYIADNLVVRAGKSHIMSKSHMIDWLNSCVLLPETPQTLYLLLDSWTSFKDKDVIAGSAASVGKTLVVRNIPAGTTSYIQPLDVYFFRPFKAMGKRITHYALVHNINFVVSQRDNILKILSTVIWDWGTKLKLGVKSECKSRSPQRSQGVYLQNSFCVINTMRHKQRCGS